MLVMLGTLSVIFNLIRGPGKSLNLLRILIYLVIIGWGVLNLFNDTAHVLFVPSIIINLLISIMISASLRDGATPLMENLIKMSAVRELPELVKREARVLTIIWSVFFFLMAFISLALALWADMATWSLFANVLYFIFLGLVILIMHGYQHLKYRKLGVPISWNSAYKLLRLYSSSSNS